MALKDLLAYVDSKLETEFLRKGHDPARERAAFIKKLENTKEKFLATEPPRGRKDFSVGNNVVAYTPSLNGRPVAIGEDASKPLYIPAERFAEFLDKLRAEVESGSLDEALKASANTDAEPAVVATPNKRKAASGGSGSGGRQWSAERRARFQATIAARQAGGGD